MQPLRKWASLALLLSLAISVIAQSQLPRIKVDPQTNLMIDSYGRYRIFHGVNVVYKIAPYYPVNQETFDPQESLCEQDIQNLYDWGFNAVRLFNSWTGGEPTRGNYNMTYINELAKIGQNLAEKDIYFLLDVHQDVFSRKTCGEGAPDWAVDLEDSLVFPTPLDIKLDYDPATGYPTIDSCLKNPFFEYYSTCAVGRAFQNLYDNKNGIQDAFAGFWQAVAKVFAGTPNLLGYELINEPWVGDEWDNVDLLIKPGLADQVNLAPFYANLHKSIRAVDDETIIFYEPSVADVYTIGFSEGPGGHEYDDRQVLAYHVYCGDVDKSGDPRSRIACSAFDSFYFDLRQAELKKLGGGAMLTEFGALSNISSGVSEVNFIANQADRFFLSWTYWQMKWFQDFTTADHPGVTESFYAVDGSLELEKVRALSRTYAYAISGTPSSTEFNPDTADFSLSFGLNPSIQEPTEIYLNEEWYYPSGFQVQVSPANTLTWTRVEKNRLHFTPVAGVTNAVEVTINIYRT